MPLVFRSLRYYWRTNLAVIAGVATAVAVLSGALMVGASVKASLRDLVIQRLGATDVVVASDRFFREDLAAAFVTNGDTTTTSAPLIQMPGVLVRDEPSRSAGAGGRPSRSRTVQVYGVDDRFWQFHGVTRSGPSDRAALVGGPLAEALGIGAGDTLLLRLDVPGAVPRESLYGRREQVGRTIRLTCDAVLDRESLGEFALQPSQADVLAIFVPLTRLQRDLAQPARVNTILVASSSGVADPSRIQATLARTFTLQDVGVTLRPLPGRLGVAIESTRLLLDAPLVRAARAAATDLSLSASEVFSYLATAIRANGREIPYSVITAATLDTGALTAVRHIAVPDTPSAGAPAVSPDDAIWLNEWASQALGVSPGEPVDVDYFRWLDDGTLASETARFRMAGVVAIGGDVDSTLAPEVPGLSDASTISDWDPPFPVDLRRIRPADDDYWSRYRATPKAFVGLARGQSLWNSRYGQVSSVRVTWLASDDDAAQTARLAERIRARLDPAAAGLIVTAVRAAGLDASKGSTDFGEYFAYFSFFLMAAAVLLAALFFRLGIEQRVREIGVLQAVGFPAFVIRRMFLAEGACLAAAGSVLGLLGAVAYGSFLVLGLRTWWVDAVGTNQVFLHVTARDLAAGAVAGMAASLGAVWWTLHRLGRTPARERLSGTLEPVTTGRQRVRSLWVTMVVAFVAAAGLLTAAALERIPDVAGFFGAGVLLLVAMLSLMAVVLRRRAGHPIDTPGWVGLVRLGARYLTSRPGRSLLCMSLIAFATFVIVSVEAFRKDGGAAGAGPSSGTGGFPLVGHAVLPVFDDPNSDTGRDALGIDVTAHPALAHARFVPFRERAGDDVSCLNLYAPREPRILGASSSFIRDARFSFQTSLSTTPEQTRNPWLLLEAATPDGAIPAIADANTIQYILHVAVGDEIIVHGDDGADVRLRLVAALRDSVLQGELIIAESAFLRAFPAREGFRFFLVDVDATAAAALAAPLEEMLAPWGVTFEQSERRLATYHRVENTYLSTFQSLGVLGLILGTIGLAAVLLRNVLERRRELALLRAVGYRGGAIAFVIVVENVLLMVGGLGCGALSACVAIVPALVARGGSLPLGAAAIMLGVVVAGGVVSSLAAVAAVWRMPLLASLRAE